MRSTGSRSGRRSSESSSGRSSASRVELTPAFLRSFLWITWGAPERPALSLVGGARLVHAEELSVPPHDDRPPRRSWRRRRGDLVVHARRRSTPRRRRRPAPPRPRSPPRSARSRSNPSARTRSSRAPVTLARGDDGEWTVRRRGRRAAVRARAEKVRALLAGPARHAGRLRELASASRDALETSRPCPGRPRPRDGSQAAPGDARLLELGAVVSEAAVAARVDGPLAAGRSRPPGPRARSRPIRRSGSRRGSLPFDAAVARRASAVSVPEEPRGRVPGVARVRTVGDPRARADPGGPGADDAAARLVERARDAGPVQSEPGAAPEVFVRYEIGDLPGRRRSSSRSAMGSRETSSRRAKETVPVGGGLAGGSRADHAAARLSSGAGGCSTSSTAEVQDVRISGTGEPGSTSCGEAARLAVRAAPEWGWKYLGRPWSLPLDPSAQADCLQALCQLEAADFETGPAFERGADGR